jgi:hypothetical protein
MPENPRNLAWLRSLQIPGVPEFGARMSELVSDLNTNDHQIAQQTNSNLTNSPQPPPVLQSVTVTPTEVGHHVSIVHEGDYYRGIVYHVESADNPHFTNPFPEYSGPAREINLATGTQRLYFQAFASYLNSGNTAPIMHGGSTPVAVKGGTSAPRGTSQSGGTARPGTGRAGYGPTPYTGSKPPARSS